MNGACFASKWGIPTPFPTQGNPRVMRKALQHSHLSRVDGPSSAPDYGGVLDVGEEEKCEW